MNIKLKLDANAWHKTFLDSFIPRLKYRRIITRRVKKNAIQKKLNRMYHEPSTGTMVVLVKVVGRLNYQNTILISTQLLNNNQYNKFKKKNVKKKNLKICMHNTQIVIHGQTDWFFAPASLSAKKFKLYKLNIKYIKF